MAIKIKYHQKKLVVLIIYVLRKNILIVQKVLKNYNSPEFTKFLACAK